MTTIYKYPLAPGNPIQVEMPKYARVLAVGAQGDGPVLWALVDPLPAEARTFYVYGTGHDAPEAPELKYLGTCQTDSGLVWHVFEKPIERNIGEMLMDLPSKAHILPRPSGPRPEPAPQPPTRENRS